MFDPIEYKPHDTPASTTSTASPTVAPKKATSRVSASSVSLTGGLSQAVEDTEDTEDSVLEVEPAVALGDTELESDVEFSVEEDDSLPAVIPGPSFSSIRESRAQFSSPQVKDVPVFKRTEELRKK